MSQQPSPIDNLLSLPGFGDNDPQTNPSGPRPRRRLPIRGRGGIIIIAIIVLLILAGILFFSLGPNRRHPTTYEYQQVTQGDLSLTVSATGPVQSSVYNVVFSGSGIITEIDVQVGQTVKQGQVLARLDKTSLQDAVNQAQAGVLSALTTMNSYEASYGATLAASKASIASAQTSVKNAQASLTTTQAQSQASIAAAGTAVQDALSSLAATLAQSQASIVAAQAALQNAQKSLGETRTEAQTSIAAAQTTLQNAQTSLVKTIAESQASVAAAQTALNDAQTNLSRVQAESSASIEVAYNQEQQAINTCHTEATPPPDCVPLAQSQYEQAVATANANVASAESQVSADQKNLASTQTQAAVTIKTAQNQVSTAASQLNSAVATANANVAAAQGQITTDQKQIGTTMANATSNDTTAQNQVNSDQAQFGTTITTATSNNTTAQNQVNSAQGQLNSTIATAALNDASAQNQINSAQGQLATAQAQLQTAQHNLNNTTLIAPHDGIITIINGTVGGTPGVPTNSTSTTALTGSTFVQIADVSSLQVEADVNEADTANLKVREPAQFTVSAYGDRQFRGTVSAISPNGQTVSNVVTYPVTIDVDMSSLQGANLLPSMTANITIDVAQRSNVLLLPVSAVNFARAAVNSNNGVPALISKDLAASALEQARSMLTALQGEKDISMENPLPAYVLEQSGSHFIAKPVVLGLTDETLYEVLAGLSVGETVVVGVQQG